MNEKDPKSRLERWALIRHSAVSWIEQSLNQGNTLGRALALASELAWSGRRYSPRTLEGWLYVNGRSELTHFRSSKIDPGRYGEERNRG